MPAPGPRRRSAAGARRRVVAGGRRVRARLQVRAVSTGEITADTTLGALAEVWLRDLADSGRSTNTRQRYDEVTRKYIVKGLHAVKIREATLGVLSTFLGKVADDIGRPTAKLVRANLSGMFQIAVAHGAVERNPVTDVKAKAPEHAEVVALTIDEVHEIRATLRTDKVAQRQDLVDVVDLLIATGARLGELLALRWSDVDLAADVPSLVITGTIIRKRGVGLVRQDKPKSAGGRRRLYLPQFAVDTLLARKVSAPANEHDVVFASSVGTLRDPTNLRTQWRAVRDRHGWGEVVPKSFCKAVATLLADDRMENASAQLGHSGTDVTSRHYIARTNETPDSRARLELFAGKSDE